MIPILKKKKMLLVIFIILLIAGTLLYNPHKAKISSAIKVLITNQYIVSYNGLAFDPEFIVIHLGDSVTIKNNSQTPMEIAVGRHENHKTLNGFQEKILNSKEGYTFTPQERGVFDLHNHFNPKKLGYLIIDK